MAWNVNVSAKRPQDKAGKGADAARGGEEPCMTRDAAERRRVVVVDFSDQIASAPVVLGHWACRGREPPQRRWEPKAQNDRLSCPAEAVRQRRRKPDHDAVEQNRKRRSTSVGGKKPQQDESQVAVHRPGSWRVLERNRADVVFELPAPRRRSIDQASGQAGRVLEQISNSDVVAIGATPLVEERRDAVFELDRSRGYQLHHDRRGRDRLRQRGEIERCVETGAERFRPQHLCARSDLDARHREHAGRSRVLDRATGVID